MVRQVRLVSLTDYSLISMSGTKRPEQLRIMIKSFRCKYTEALYQGQRVREFESCQNQAERRLQILDNVKAINDLMALPSYRFEALSGDRAGQYSIRVNQKWRLCFEWKDTDAYNVEIVEYH